MGRLNIAMNGGQMPQKNMRPRISPYSRQPVDLQKAVQKCLRIADRRQWYGLQHFLRRQPKVPGTVLFHLLLADVTFGGKINHLIIGLLEIISVNEALNDLRGCLHLVTVFGFLGWNGNELATAWNWGYSAIFGWDGNHLVAFLDGRLHLP